MAERTWIEQVVERVVNQVLETHVPRLREDIVQRVMVELQPELQPTSAGERGAKPAELLRAISEIHAGSSQKDILRALLDGCARYCGRAALFVVKGGIATGWQGRGFGEGDTVKDFVLDVSGGLVSQALGERAAVTGPSAEMDRRFIERFGGPATPEVTVLPLMLKDKVAALIYGDAGSEGRLDSPRARAVSGFDQRLARSRILKKAVAKGWRTRRDSPTRFASAGTVGSCANLQ